jgi:Mg2+ and Co2+ transporter CorA
MTLQKLVKLPLESDSESDSEDSSSSYIDHAGVKRKKSWLSKLSDLLFHRNLPYHRRKRQLTEVAHSQDGIMSTHPCSKPSLPQPRTLQRYHGGPNIERMSFMEEHSAMTRKNLAVCAEQVSIFLTADNTVISFFETSAQDIETPILKRLATPETILRRSCDASMLTQAIIDAIIDLAMPISTTYSEIIQELELDVLTEPSINHTRELYILTSETTTMRNFISPIATLVRALRDHAGEKSLNAENPDKNGSGRAPGAGAAGLEISPTTHVYLSDVEDHTLLILSVLEQISASASGLISLIFNTISAYQNETMRQLTAATILFLPMTFITGYYGMNLQNLHGLDRDDAYFWSIALPVIFGTVLCLIWGGVGRKFGGWWKKLGRRRRRHSRERRERREEREMEKREKEKKEKKEQNEVSKRK